MDFHKGIDRKSDYHVMPFGWEEIIEGVFPGGSDSKESTCNVGDLGSIPGLERSPGEGNGYPLQYPSLENPMDRGAWQAMSLTWLRDFHFQIVEEQCLVA